MAGEQWKFAFDQVAKRHNGAKPPECPGGSGAGSSGKGGGCNGLRDEHDSGRRSSSAHENLVAREMVGGKVQEDPDGIGWQPAADCDGHAKQSGQLLGRCNDADTLALIHVWIYGTS